MLNSIFFQGDDLIRMKLSALREIFRNFAPNELPAEFAACLAGDEQAIAANHAAYRIREMEEEQRRMTEQPHGSAPTAEGATQDPVHGTPTARLSAPGLSPSRSRISPRSGMPQSHASPHSLLLPDHASTVHRTDFPRGKRTQADMAIQVCTSNSYKSCAMNSISWDPRVLFPEISASVSQTTKTNVNVNTTKEKKRGTTKNKVLPPQKPRRSVRNKKSRIENGDKGMIDIEVQDFLNVPLRLDEGKELLALIGANNIPIPTHITLPPLHQQMSNLEVGQSSGAQQKRNKHMSPTRADSSRDQAQIESEVEGLHMGLLNTDEAQLTTHTLPLNQLGNNVNHMQVIDSALQPIVDDTNVSDEPEDDPYFERVDYSDEEVDL